MKSFLTAALNPLCRGLPYGPKYISPPPKWPDCGERSVSICLTYDSIIEPTTSSSYHYVFYPTVPSRKYGHSCPDAETSAVLWFNDSPYSTYYEDAGKWYTAQYFDSEQGTVSEVVNAYKRVVGFGMCVTAVRPTGSRLDSTQTPPFRYEVVFDRGESVNSFNPGIYPELAGNHKFDHAFLHTQCGIDSWDLCTSGYTSRSNDAVYVRYIPTDDNKQFYKYDTWNVYNPSGYNKLHHWRLPILHLYRAPTVWDPWCDRWHVQLALHLECLTSFASVCLPCDIVPPSYSYGTLCHFLSSFDPIVRHVRDLYPKHSLSSGMRAIL